MDCGWVKKVVLQIKSCVENQMLTKVACVANEKYQISKVVDEKSCTTNEELYQMPKVVLQTKSCIEY